MGGTSRGGVNNNNSNEAGIIVANRAGDEETEDGRIRNREAAAKIRDAWIYKQIRARQVRERCVCIYMSWIGYSIGMQEEERMIMSMFSYTSYYWL